MEEIVYIRFKKSIQVEGLEEIKLKDIALISTNSKHKSALEKTKIYQITEKDHNIIIIDSFFVIDYLNKQNENLEFQPIGPVQTIIRVEQSQKKTSIFMVACVWLILFIGTAMTIMNFHYDVSMQEVQQKLHYLLTGNENEFPLWIQIPYSFGLGVGMILFLNHWFKKKINEEPSPLEVELFNYQQDLDKYISHYENQLNEHKDTF
ncbi:MAG TPA: stage V sporulation protein AA [Candidatus Dormibacteraeota bacterium]|nr:stage V sporulation protein AA [Candidatus Dormibacteraeota bacterium]